MKNKKPAIRFKGFSEDWEEKELNKLSILITKGTTPLDKKSNGTINYVKIENINSISGEITITSKITEQEHENYLKRSQLKDNDILFSIAGTLGRVTVVRENILPANTNQALAIIRLINSNISFVTTYLKGKAVSEYVRRNPTVGAQPNLSLQQVGSLEIPLPSNNEQTKIGNFFKNLDNLITLHQRKYEKLGILKKAMLEKMFPKNGADVPEIRFKGFDGAWDERTLGEMVQIKDSARVPKGLWTESGVRYLRSSDLENNGQGGELFISMDAYENYKAKTGVPELGDVLFNSGGDIGFSILKTDSTPVYVQGGAILYARTSQSKEIDGGYLNVYFSTPQMIKYIGIASAGGTIKHFTLKPANAAPFVFPNIIEQRKVSEFFVQLDNLLMLHQGELTKLKNLKKAMLEKMFV